MKKSICIIILINLMLYTSCSGKSSNSPVEVNQISSAIEKLINTPTNTPKGIIYTPLPSSTQLPSFSSESKISLKDGSLQTNEQLEIDTLTVMETTVDFAIYDDYESLYNRADLIIIGEPEDDIIDAEPIKVSRHSWREVKIHEVLKGDIKDKTMKVAESATIADNGGEETLFYPSQYSIMQRGMKYLLFLNKDLDGYYIISVNQGKFNIDGKDTKEKVKESSDSQYAKLKKDVLSKYNKN